MRAGKTRRLSAVIFSVAAMASCAVGPPPEPTAADPDLDPWGLTIAAERYGVLIDLARQGAILGPPAMTLQRDENLNTRAARATRHAVRDLYALRALVCASQLVGAEDCGPLAPPDWLGEPVDAVPDLAEIQARVDWIAETAAPFIAAGCEAGDSRSTEADALPYCAVE